MDEQAGRRVVKAWIGAKGSTELTLARSIWVMAPSLALVLR